MIGRHASALYCVCVKAHQKYTDEKSTRGNKTDNSLAPHDASARAHKRPHENTKNKPREPNEENGSATFGAVRNNNDDIDNDNNKQGKERDTHRRARIGKQKKRAKWPGDT